MILAEEFTKLWLRRMSSASLVDTSCSRSVSGSSRNSA
jgi:hypothetical protein